MAARDFWHWEAHKRYNMDTDSHEYIEDTAVCQICRESWTLGDWTPEQVCSLVEEHMRDDHGGPFTHADSFFEIRERSIIGVEVDHSASDCDGPLQQHRTGRLSDGTTWSQYIGREITMHPPEGFEIHNDGLMFSWGGPTDEGYTHTAVTAIFAHESYKLDEPDSQRDVYAERMGY